MQPFRSKELIPRCRNTQQFSYEMTASSSSQLCYVECDDTFFASQTTMEWKGETAETPTYLSFSMVKMQSPTDNEQL